MERDRSADREHWYVRISEDVSALLGAGQRDARRYPLGRLSFEASLVRERANQQSVTEAVLIQAAIGSALSKEGSKNFKTIIEGLNGGGTTEC